MIIFQYRKYFIFFNQLIGIIFCIYFILNVKSYHVSSPILNYIFPSITLKVNEMIASIGTFFLIIPLTIIIMSMLYPESYKLKIYSTFFGITSTLITLSKTWWQNKLGDYYDFKIILVSKLYTLAEKRILLKEALINIINEKYKNMTEQYNYLQEALINNYTEIYDKKLDVLSNNTSIYSYADEIIIKQANIFIANKNASLNTQAEHLSIAAKIIFYTLITIVAVSAVAAVWRFLNDSDSLKKGAELAKETANLSSQNTDSLASTQQIVAEVLPVITDHTIATSIVVGNQISAATDNAFQKVAEKVVELENKNNILENAQNVIVSELIKLKQIIHDHFT